MNTEKNEARDAVEMTVPGWGSVEFGRRLGLKALAGTAAVGGVAALAGASAAAASVKSSTIKIGYVTPKTGALSDFAGPDNFVLSLIRSSSYFKKGMKIGGHQYHFEIIVKDSQSSASIASQVTQQLIQSSGVDIVVTLSLIHI